MRWDQEVPAVPSRTKPVTEPPPGPPSPSLLSQEDRRWLHETYRQFDLAEGQLADYRSSYTAAITTAIVAAMVYAVVNLLPKGQLLFAVTVSLLSAFGLLISSVWALVLRRTTEAQNLWRQAAFELEECAPPVPGPLFRPIPVRPGVEIPIDLTQPYHAHARRFQGPASIPRLDRVRPAELAGWVPVILLIVWAVVLAGVWTWYLFG